MNYYELIRVTKYSSKRALFIKGVLFPELPAEQNWEEYMCAKLNYHRQAGRRLNIVIVAEGATDKNGKLIASEYVKNVLLFL